jgi:hypothetical protein
VAVQRPQHSNSCAHQEVPAFGGIDQALGGGLPLVELLLGLRKPGDVVAGSFKDDELSTIAQRDRIIERLLPARRRQANRFAPACVDFT